MKVLFDTRELHFLLQHVPDFRELRAPGVERGFVLHEDRPAVLAERLDAPIDPGRAMAAHALRHADRERIVADERAHPQRVRAARRRAIVGRASARIPHHFLTAPRAPATARARAVVHA